MKLTVLQYKTKQIFPTQANHNFQLDRENKKFSFEFILVNELEEACWIKIEIQIPDNIAYTGVGNPKIYVYSWDGNEWKNFLQPHPTTNYFDVNNANLYFLDGTAATNFTVAETMGRKVLDAICLTIEGKQLILWMKVILKPPHLLIAKPTAAKNVGVSQ